MSESIRKKKEVSRRLNRKQSTALRRSRNAVFNLDQFFTSGWTIEDWGKLPRVEEGWRAVPDKDFLIVRIKSVHFSDGASRRFYQQVARPETRRETCAPSSRIVQPRT